MNELYNESSRRIIEYLKNNEGLTLKERRNLLHYATQLCIYNIENIEKVNLKDYLNDLRFLYNYLSTSDINSITKDRITRLYHFIKLYEAFENEKNIEIPNDILNELSYELDLLYLDSNLPPRKNSSLSYNLKSKKTKVM